MSRKAIDAMRRMASDVTPMIGVHRLGPEFYFRYDGSVFSIMKTDDEDYEFFVYPNWRLSPEGLAQAIVRDPEQLGESIPFVQFKSDEFSHDVDAFRNLYRAAENRFHDIDAIFDQIINKPPPF